MNILSQTLVLNDGWRCNPDPFEEGERLGWSDRDFQPCRWRETVIPCTFETAIPELDGYIGTVWFRTRFDVPDTMAAGSIRLQFGACNNRAVIWVNGERLGEHRDAFTPFGIDATPAIRPGVNHLAIRLDNAFGLGDLPGRPAGWRSCGGILRPVTVRLTPPVYLDDLTACGDAGGRLPVRATLVNNTGSTQAVVLGLTLRDPADAGVARQEMELTLEPGTTPLTLDLTVPAPTVWTPDTPACYRLTADLASVTGRDTITLQTGFRGITVVEGRLLLNGTPIILRGFNRHDDSPATLLAADPQLARRDLETMKADGANFVRLAHYPHDPATLDTCDTLGLLAMAEIPLYWWHGNQAGDEFHDAVLAAARRMLADLVQRDRHHPSVMAWSVGNENAEERPEVVAGLEDLIRWTRSLDTTRPVVHVSHRWTEHPHFDADDLICVNAYPAYQGRCDPVNPDYDFADATRWWREQLDNLHRRYPHKPVLITEFGYPAINAGGGYGIGEDTQVQALRAEAAAFHEPFVCGYAIWCFADHAWPDADFLRGVRTSPYGLWTRQRTPKPAAAIVRELFTAAESAVPTPSARHRADNHSVRMVRPHLDRLPVHPFPDGYGLRPMRPDEAGLWEDIQRDAEPFFGIPPGLFVAEFGSDLPAAWQRCFLVVNARDCAVGTISAWYSRDADGGEWGRIHWLAIRPAFQGRGLGKAALSAALAFMAERHHRAWLATSTGRVSAISMYLDTGFEPDLRPAGAADAWRQFCGQHPHPALARLV